MSTTSLRTLPDGRLVPPPQADERATLESWLDFFRETLALKCAGLDDEQARQASAEPSTLTLIGLVQHLARVECIWFQRVFAGLDVWPEYADGVAPDAGFELVEGRGIEEVLSVWRAQVARGRELIADAKLDDLGTLTEFQTGYVGAKEASLRWIMFHVLGEYARHDGHADLLRERIDGVTGM